VKQLLRSTQWLPFHISTALVPSHLISHSASDYFFCLRFSERFAVDWQSTCWVWHCWTSDNKMQLRQPHIIRKFFVFLSTGISFWPWFFNEKVFWMSISQKTSFNFKCSSFWFSYCITKHLVLHGRDCLWTVQSMGRNWNVYRFL